MKFYTNKFPIMFGTSSDGKALDKNIPMGNVFVIDGISMGQVFLKSVDNKKAAVVDVATLRFGFTESDGVEG